MISTQTFTFDSEGHFFTVNITDQVRNVVKESGVRDGSVLVFYKHTTGAVIIVEHEAGSIVDLEEMLERIAPVAADYKHHRRGWDTNGAAHIRTALLSVSTTIPVISGDMMLGTYQEILVVDMDNTQKTRTVVIQVSGE